MAVRAKTKIWASLGVLVMFNIVIASIGLRTTQLMNDRLEVMLADNLRKVGLSTRLAKLRMRPQLRSSHSHFLHSKPR